MHIINEVMKFQIERQLHIQPYDWTNETKNILEEICEADGMDIPKQHRSMIFEPVIQHMRALIHSFTGKQFRVPDIEERVDAHADQIVFNIGAIMKLGYCPSCVMEEVIKEINSRKGEIVNGKFEKYLGEAHTKNWYKANFTNCKLLT